MPDLFPVPRLPPIFVAIDTTDMAAAIRLSHSLTGRVHGVKLGLEFFSRHGHAGVLEVLSGHRLFLDLKFHDIPNTVAGAVHAVAPLRPDCLTIHVAGGLAMMRAARRAADAAAAALGCQPMRLLGVTALTSLDESDLASLGQNGPIGDQVERLTGLAVEAGLDGVIASPQEAARLRRRFGPELLLVVPGIRPAQSELDDQKRVMTPAEAMAAGASYLVIGRPITGASDPVAATQAITQNLAGSLAA